jgi:hypothetical protein
LPDIYSTENLGIERCDSSIVNISTKSGSIGAGAKGWIQMSTTTQPGVHIATWSIPPNVLCSEFNSYLVRSSEGVKLRKINATIVPSKKNTVVALVDIPWYCSLTFFVPPAGLIPFSFMYDYSAEYEAYDYVKHRKYNGEVYGEAKGSYIGWYAFRLHPTLMGGVGKEVNIHIQKSIARKILNDLSLQIERDALIENKSDDNYLEPVHAVKENEQRMPLDNSTHEKLRRMLRNGELSQDEFNELTKGE